VHDWALGTADDDWVSMAVASDGSYGIPEGVVFSLPVRCVRGDYQIVQGLEIDEFARGKLKATDTELREERAGVADLL
jgi:malate dehydrogenase